MNSFLASIAKEEKKRGKYGLQIALLRPGDMENFTGIELKSILLSDIEIMMPTFVLIVVK